MNLFLKHIARFFFLVLLQVFVINNLDLGSFGYWMAPTVYISYILTFPNHHSKYILLSIAFLLGLTVDMFLNTYGIHASACLMMAYSRTFMTKQLEAQSSFEDNFTLTIYTIENTSYIKYLTVLTFIFFFWLFLLEEFNLRYIFAILLKTILSTILSVILILIGQYLLLKKHKI